MQRFGTPDYTQPQILRNEYYDEKVLKFLCITLYV